MKYMTASFGLPISLPPSQWEGEKYGNFELIRRRVPYQLKISELFSPSLGAGLGVGEKINMNKLNSGGIIFPGYQ